MSYQESMKVWCGPVRSGVAFRWGFAILDFSLPVEFYNFPGSSIEQLYSENINSDSENSFIGYVQDV